ncbi:MAG: 2-C-methyl-D-erythritol 4-phosphate cytidylyltransferase [Bacteroidetes bacterium]|nr:2-C-methyl-D-erythritol 4-phosphate cytidylyltransferase [Bacteroidota bacterium]
MRALIIVAGGTGSRMNAELPKQLLPIHQKPIIVHSIEKFVAFDASMQIIISLHSDYFNLFEQIKNTYNLSVQVVSGGDTRFHSVQNALAVLHDEVNIVGVHDAARPLVSLQTIENTFSAAEKLGAAIPVIDMNESLREVENNTSKAVDRTKYKTVQTPQCFKKNILIGAYETPYNPLFTDDASVVEKNGYKIFLTEGNIENIKITYPQDLRWAEMLLHAST